MDWHFNNKKLGLQLVTQRLITCRRKRLINGVYLIETSLLKHKETSLLEHLHELLLQCWEEGSVPQDMCDANIITLYKNKGDRSDCNNYRGISLHSIVGKTFACVMLNRLQTLAECVYPEAQCGFRAQRSTIDMIFSLRQLQEKCREQTPPCTSLLQT